MVSAVFGILWWHVGCLYRCCVTMFAFVAFTIVHEHGGQISVQRYVALAHAEAMCLRCVCIVLEALLAWRGVAFQQRSVSLGSPPSLRFLSYLFISLFFLAGVCSFYFHLASGLSVTGVIVGGWAQGARGWVVGW